MPLLQIPGVFVVAAPSGRARRDADPLRLSAGRCTGAARPRFGQGFFPPVNVPVPVPGFEATMSLRAATTGSCSTMRSWTSISVPSSSSISSIGSWGDSEGPCPSEGPARPGGHVGGAQYCRGSGGVQPAGQAPVLSNGAAFSDGVRGSSGHLHAPQAPSGGSHSGGQSASGASRVDARTDGPRAARWARNGGQARWQSLLTTGIKRVPTTWADTTSGTARRPER